MGQSRYLEEAIALDNLPSDRLGEGIAHTIQQYVAQHFTSDQARQLAAQQLCQDASVHHANKCSKDLSRLLREHQARLPPVLAEQTGSLEAMKSVNGPQRFGDIVFLPQDAEVFVIGDTHADLASTQRIIEEIKSSGAMARGAFVVFLGDYVNNGLKSWQNLAEILRFQHAHPDAVVLLSGNHEFKESYITALNQYFNTHWERFSVEELPKNLQDRLPELNNHYGHMRLDLVRSFGFEEGERLYSVCFDWGLNLPCICVSGNLMISHSLGKLKGQEIQLPELLNCKQHDVENLKRMGYETWQANRPSLHSALMNNRIITAELLGDFSRALEVQQFVVGHCHYRSGDTLQLGENSVTTIVSSAPFSPDSGHYMYQQMMVERGIKRPEENLINNNATAGYLKFAKDQAGSGKRHFSLIGIG